MPPVRRPLALRAAAYGAIIATVVVLAVTTVASFFATPLTTPGAPVPVWTIEMTSATDQPVTALVYGPEAGLHLFRVPGASDVTHPRTVPARLGQGELHAMSLGWSPLRLRASAPRGVRPMSWSSTSRTATAFQNADGIGVRTSWW